MVLEKEIGGIGRKISRTHDSNTTTEILKSLWRWKLLTTAALSAMFFRDLKPHPAYPRLHYLRKKKLIAPVTNPFGQRFLWALTRTGFESIKPDLPPLREEKFRSQNQERDHLVTAILLGDSVLSQSPAESWFTDQELRSYEPKLFPVWVPRSDKHRADGYWKIGNGALQKIFGLEVDPSCNLNADYQSISAYYRLQDGVDGVNWFCGSIAKAEIIHRLVRDADESSQAKHCFFTVADFYRAGWGAT